MSNLTDFEFVKLITEGKSEEYYADVEWYLSHGYITITQMRNEIENGGFK